VRGGGVRLPRTQADREGVSVALWRCGDVAMWRSHRHRHRHRHTHRPFRPLSLSGDQYPFVSAESLVTDRNPSALVIQDWGGVIAHGCIQRQRSPFGFRGPPGSSLPAFAAVIGGVFRSRILSLSLQEGIRSFEPSFARMTLRVP
jgi:hypothetical protein